MIGGVAGCQTAAAHVLQEKAGGLGITMGEVPLDHGIVAHHVLKTQRLHLLEVCERRLQVTAMHAGVKEAVVGEAIHRRSTLLQGVEGVDRPFQIPLLGANADRPTLGNCSGGCLSLCPIQERGQAPGQGLIRASLSFKLFKHLAQGCRVGGLAQGHQLNDVFGPRDGKEASHAVEATTCRRVVSLLQLCKGRLEVLGLKSSGKVHQLVHHLLCEAL
mmetsp:Transcript_61744/g.132729  ORF Transcript_61744/g.132729 Transcript_61744/m.132729 type:complete len:217 (+) Transcript_61744:1644-2294(+)